MPVRHRPDDVLRAEGGIAAEKYVLRRRLESGFVQYRHAGAVKFNPRVAFDPGEGILLPHRDQDVIAFKELIWIFGFYQRSFPGSVVDGFYLLENHARQFAVRDLERFRHQEIQDRDALVRGVFLFPGARLHLVEARAHDDLDVVPADAPRGAAAVHGGIAAAQHDDPLADLRGVAEGHRGEPVDADVDVLGRFLASRDVEVAAA